ncbi:hypothetical protein HN371_27675 [Candidatus Poribacteria bacterium]|jgi:hypothetical protein|nr:hypothetical protein [Candidatus Poribacteria bacterium]MBT5533707.1 hypothetical protein [Candidatus Poribacteria bacterium]MBT7095937.1 hypothetical protein [Candidatus Poribacteria bacterium]MBT7807936.1 hypothetical protein [Candidatus Poribacteria bacterium]
MAELDQPQRTVIMLGAGASAASKYALPVMYGFFDPDCGTPISEQLSSGLCRIYGDVDIRRINVEDVFGHLDMAAHYRDYAETKTLLDTAYLEALRIELERYVAQRLEIPHPEPTMPGFPRQDMYVAPEETDLCHRALFQSHLNPALDGGYRSTVITTNYDLVADYALRALEKEVWPTSSRAFRMEKLSGVRGRISLSELPSGNADPVGDAGWYLKLHGSLEWFYCPNEDCAKRAECFSAIFDTEWGLGFNALPEHFHPELTCICGAHWRQLIVPPTMAKDYRKYPTLETQWRLAVRHLQEANRIVIVGLSFAPSDVRLTWLMRHGLRWFGDRTIDVVYRKGRHDPADPQEHSVVRRVRDFVPNANVNAYGEGFASYLVDTGAVDHHAVDGLL